jgi:hypothetical protein
MNDRIHKLLEAKVRGIFFFSSELEDYTRPDDLDTIIKELTRFCNEYCDRMKRYFGPEFTFEAVEDETPVKRVKVLIQMPPMHDSGAIVIGHLVLRYEEDPATHETVLVIDSGAADGDSPSSLPHQGLGLPALLDIMNRTGLTLKSAQESQLSRFLDGLGEIVQDTDERYTFDLTLNEDMVHIVTRQNYRLFGEFMLSRR